MFARTREAFGTIDILDKRRTAAGCGCYRDDALEEWNRVLEVTLTGQFLCAREAVWEFQRRGVVPQISRAAAA
jgi:glucose 1-dehydrogenase